MKTLTATLGLVATLALPLAASAQTTMYTYEYVNTSGQIASISAPDATTALNTAPALALHSGVMYIANSTQALPSMTVSL
jgi:hypothetical protein